MLQRAQKKARVSWRGQVLLSDHPRDLLKVIGVNGALIERRRQSRGPLWKK
jgi:hypothetical protein